MQKLGETGARAQRQRARSGDPVAEDASGSAAAGAGGSSRSAAQRGATAATATAGSRSPRPTTTPPGSGTCWTARSRTADALYQRFPGEQSAVFRRRAGRDQLRAAVSRDARQEASRSGEALPRYPRPRELGEPQPAQPVVQAGAGAERSGRARRELRLADGVARRRRGADRHQGLLQRRPAHVAGRRGQEDCTSPAASAPPATKASASRIRCRTSPPIPKPVRC